MNILGIPRLIEQPTSAVSSLPRLYCQVTYENVLHVHSGLKFGARFEERRQSFQVKFIGKHLDDAFHEIFLSDGIAAAHHLLKNTG